MFKIKITTYEEDRLYFFVDQVSLAQKKYNRLFKTFKDAPYLSEGALFLSDAGRELQFYKDVVEMLDKGYRKQEWISVDDRLPEESGVYLAYTYNGNRTTLVYSAEHKLFNTFDSHSRDVAEGYAIGVTHWMPLPEPPKMKGGAE